ncbi:hypothetical protein H072_11052 [Dactylellina haptotyla CBS 200.50]|uniref:Ankyrin repeat protein n=1 Tax=Dactylellina haptotyla (strain CBS 200.50) TaxID=1284197 RepID=S7ZYP0_DACHA|nr:hypothetical protein H072_11052 [Dactylellina haptotyla CBS 200.50]
MSGPLPALPTEPKAFLEHIGENEGKPLRELVKPYLEYESNLRRLFAQEPDHPALVDNLVGLVPLYDGHDDKVKIQSRNIETESPEEQGRYIMTLDEEERKESGQRAIVDRETFIKNFTKFTEGSLANLNWSHIVAAGSSVMTPLLPVPEDYNEDNSTLADYYHSRFAPTSDIDLFIYGTKDEAVAIKRIEAVEKTIIKNLEDKKVLSVRTKNTITIVSEYPNRHIQIVLRLYSSISEILTGFDVSCACVAYDGQQVYANPRAIVSLMLQCNDIDLSRRSPSYEFRLAKYRKRGFEIYYADLDRKIIDPTIYERHIRGVKGLAKLLVLERLPTEHQQDAYANQRRRERNRPERKKPKRERKILNGDLKGEGGEIPDWGINTIETDESAYETIAIPYGPRFNAERIKKLLFQGDLFLNSEWNTRIQKRRAGYLHRHAAFFGSVKFIVNDCCGHCPDPDPENSEEKELRIKDDRYYIRGRISFIKDDPGRQEIGSFNPITEEDWTDMAYLSVNEVLCRAIVANDPETVKAWLAEGNDVNKRDYTGRSPLHLAALASTAEIVRILLDAGARMTARIFDGRTALHIAAARGDVEIAKVLLLKSQQNEKEKEEREERAAQKRAAETADAAGATATAEGEATATEGGTAATPGEPDVDMKDADEKASDGKGEANEDDDMSIISEGSGSVSARTGVSSFVDVHMRSTSEDPELGEIQAEEEVEDDIIEINKTDWDYQFSALHYAIVHGHEELVTMLVSEFGADVLQPVILSYTTHGVPSSVLLSLSLIYRMVDYKAKPSMLRTLLKLGASSAQTDMNGISALMRVVQKGDLECLKIMFEEDSASATAALKYLNTEYNEKATNPLISAISGGHAEMALLLLEHGAKPELDVKQFVKATKPTDYQRDRYIVYSFQPAELALRMEMPDVFEKCIELGANPSTYTAGSMPTDKMQTGYMSSYHKKYMTLLDLVQQKLKSWNEELTGIDKRLEDESKPAELKKPKEPKFKAILPVPEIYKEGTYEHWMASKIIQTENKSREYHNEQEIERRKPPAPFKSNLDMAKVELKKAKIVEMVERWNGLVELLLSKDAKTFKALHPDIWWEVFGKPAAEALKAKEEAKQLAEARAALQAPQPEPEKKEEEEKKEEVEEDKFEVEFTFEIEKWRKLDSKMTEAYQELYKAVWDGDAERVKKYTTTNWEEDIPPLLMATKNQLDYTPFSIAVLRKHPHEFLDLILNIAQAQYLRDNENAKKEQKEKVYLLDGELEFEMEEFDFTEVKLTSTVAEEEDKDHRLRANVRAINVLSYAVPFVVGDKDDNRKEILLNQAIYAGDNELAKYITSRSEIFDKVHVTPGAQLPVKNDNNLSNNIIKLENIEMLKDFMEKYGLGTVFDGKNEFKYDDSDSEGEQSDAEMEDDEPKPESQEKKPYKRPKQYLGLSINGKKQKEWTNLMNPNYYGPPRLQYEDPPLALFAAYHGSQKVFEWLETNGPQDAIRQWQGRIEKSEGAKKSYFLKVLQAADEETIKSWMGIEHPLLLHAVVMNDSVRKDKKRLKEDKFAWYENNLKFFAEKSPEHLEYRKNRKGFTPLLLAASKLNKYAMKALLDLGADPYAKVPDGNYNLIHMMIQAFINNYSYPYYSYSYHNYNRSNVNATWKKLRDCLALLPADVKKWAFCQRATNNQILYTPLAYALAYLNNNDKTPIFKLLLEHSQGADTRIRTSLGDLPVHTLAKKSTLRILQCVLDSSPVDVLMAENTNGLTALELATLAWYKDHVLCGEAGITFPWQSHSGRDVVSSMAITKDPVINVPELTDEEKYDEKLRRKDWGIRSLDDNSTRAIKMLQVSLKKAVDGGAGMRTLVSLKDVNETAERLANRGKYNSSFCWSEGGRYDDIVYSW